MKDLFYIIEVRPQWYNLLLKDTHFCLSCGDDLESIKRTIYKYVRKYKTVERVYSAMKGLSNNGTIPPKTLQYRQEDYDNGKHLPFCDVVKEVVEQALKENRQDTPFNRTKKVVKKVSPQKVANTPAPDEVRSVAKKITPMKIRRTLTT